MDHQYQPQYIFSSTHWIATYSLETHTPSSISHSSHSPEPKPVQICQHTRSEIDRINHCREYLLQNFPEDHSKGTFANPILIEDDDNDDNEALLSEK
jgi:hypothetical protein